MGKLHITVSCVKSDEEEKLKAFRRKRNTTFKVKTVRLIGDFSREIIEARRQHNGMLIVLTEKGKKKKSQLNVLCLKSNYQNEDGIDKIKMETLSPTNHHYK